MPSQYQRMGMTKKGGLPRKKIQIQQYMKYSLGIKNSDLQIDFNNEIKCCGHPEIKKPDCSTKNCQEPKVVSIDFGDCLSCKSGVPTHYSLILVGVPHVLLMWP